MGGILPALARLPFQASNSVSVLCRPPLRCQLSPSAYSKVFTSASFPSLYFCKITPFPFDICGSSSIGKINNFLRSHCDRLYVVEIFILSGKDLNFLSDGEICDQLDELYETALNIVKSEGKASTSFLQRKLQIGYNRAARIIDMMEEKGIVSKANHVGKREVL